MPIRRTEAIVLKTMRMGETSSLLTLYTREAGLLKLVAKGARQQKSRYGGLLQPLYVIEAIYYDKETRDLQLLSQASLVWAPRQVQTDIDRLGLCLACCEMILRLENEGHGNPAAYGLLRATLETFDQAETNIRPLFLAFQVRLLELLGFSPGMDHCFHCQQPTIHEGRYDFINGRLYCQSCMSLALQGQAVSQDMIDAYRELARLPLSSVITRAFPKGAIAGVYRFLHDFFRYHLEEVRQLNAINVLKKLKTMQGEFSQV